jgi:hypothetical protein
MNNEEAKRLMQTLYEFWVCDHCQEYCATWNDGCSSPLHKIHEWGWEEYE